MSFDPVFPADKCRTGAELIFHNTEVLFNFPTLLIDPDDLVYISFQIGHYCIKSIVHCLFFNLFPVKIIHCFFGDFSINSNSGTFHKSHGIIGIFPFSLFLW